MNLPGVNLALANAVRSVNAAHERLPQERRLELSRAAWLALERELDEADLSGHRDAALAAIERWRADALRQLHSVEAGRAGS